MTPSFSRRRVAIVGAVVLSLIVAGGVLSYLGSWRVRQSVRAVAGGLAPVALAKDTERLVLRDQPLLVGELYSGADDLPLFILAHGSSPLGRRHSLVRVLATRLQRGGYPVLAVDLSGFGESEAPSLPLEEGLRFEEDLVTAAIYSLEHGLAGSAGFVYVGHSLGAGVALLAGRLEPAPVAVVALGAPDTEARRRVRGEAWLESFATDRLRDMRLPAEPDSVDAMGRYLIRMDIVRQVMQSDHPPILAVRGEHEDWSRVAEQMRARSLADPSIDLLEIGGAGHYYRTRTGPWGLDMAFHDPPTTEELVRAITAWLPTS